MGRNVGSTWTVDDDHSALKGKDAWPPAMMVTDPEVVMLGDVAQTQKDMCWVTPLRGGTGRGQTHRQRVEDGAGARGAGRGGRGLGSGCFSGWNLAGGRWTVLGAGAHTTMQMCLTSLNWTLDTADS